MNIIIDVVWFWRHTIVRKFHRESCAQRWCGCLDPVMVYWKYDVQQGWVLHIECHIYEHRCFRRMSRQMTCGSDDVLLVCVHFIARAVRNSGVGVLILWWYIENMMFTRGVLDFKCHVYEHRCFRRMSRQMTCGSDDVLLVCVHDIARAARNSGVGVLILWWYIENMMFNRGMLDIKCHIYISENRWSQWMLSLMLYGSDDILLCANFIAWVVRNAGVGVLIWHIFGDSVCCLR